MARRTYSTLYAYVPYMLMYPICLCTIFEVASLNLKWPQYNYSYSHYAYVPLTAYVFTYGKLRYRYVNC